MLPIMWMIFTILGIGLIIGGYRVSYQEGLGLALKILGWILVVGFGFMLIAWPFDYFTSVKTIADLESFYQANRQNYEVIADQTGEAVIYLADNSLLKISVENLKQSTNWSERLKELRDGVLEYNRERQRLINFNKNLWLDWLFAEVPTELPKILLD